MSDAFDPPPGDAGGLSACATQFGTVSADLSTHANAADKAIHAAISDWRGPRTADFQEAAFGLQVQVRTTAGAAGTVSQAIGAYARAFAQTCSDIAAWKAQAQQAQDTVDAQAVKQPPNSTAIDQLFQHAAIRQGQLEEQARQAKADLATLAGRLAAAVDAETNSLVPGGASVSPAAIRSRVDATTGISALPPAVGALTLTQAWNLMAAAQQAAHTILGVPIDNRDGEKPGGPVSTMTTDEATLKSLLDAARADGLFPGEYAGLLAQYWAVKASNKAGIDLNAWDPQHGTDGNRGTISAVYTFYGSLFLQHPELTWAGMANMIGPSFAAGFLDLDRFHDLAKTIDDAINQLPGPAKAVLPDIPALGVVSHMSAEEFQWFEDKFLAMQKHIFFDQGSMHAAYVDGGTANIQEMLRAGLIDDKTAAAWNQIASGDPTSVQAGNTQLLSREQNQVIADQYDQMYHHDGPVGPAMTYLMTTAGSASIPGTKAPAEYKPWTVTGTIDVSPIPFVDENVGVKVSTPLPDFNVADRQARWDYVTHDTLPAYQKLLQEHPDEAHQIVASSVDDRISQQRLSNRLPSLAEELLTNWDVSPTASISLGWPFN